MTADGIRRWAEFSDCGTYRYTLGREWDESLRRLLFILLNPSTADAQHDDPTNRLGVGFAKRWGYGSVLFVNLFAFRTPYPVDLKRASDPVGPDNDHWIQLEATRADRIVAAWGVHGVYRRRNRAVMRQVQGMYCLGLTKAGHPLHPLRQPGNLELVPFDLRARQLEKSA